MNIYPLKSTPKFVPQSILKGETPIGRKLLFLSRASVPLLLALPCFSSSFFFFIIVSMVYLFPAPTAPTHRAAAAAPIIV